MDRDKVIKGLEVCKENDCSNCPYNLEAGISNERVCLIDDLISDALAVLKEQPDIVRCKDCKWYDPLSSLCDNCGLPREGMFFCADGKRKVET